MIIAVLGLAGLILGSFVNALVWRFHKQAELAENGPKKGIPAKAKLSLIKGRSMCSNCHHELAPKDLIPLFSWIWLKGKCRYCRQPIQDSPWVEVVLPVLFITSFLYWPFSLLGEGLYLFVFWLIFLVGFMALTVYDLRWYLLPNRIVFPLISLAFLQVFGQLIWFDGGWQLILNCMLGIAVASGIFYVLYLASGGGWIGGGDVKLGIVLGILAGAVLPAMLILFIASLLGTLAATPQLLRGRTDRATKIPFGPYLMGATIIVVIFGERMIRSYYNLFGLA